MHKTMVKTVGILPRWLLPMREYNQTSFPASLYYFCRHGTRAVIIIPNFEISLG